MSISAENLAFQRLFLRGEIEGFLADETITRLLATQQLSAGITAGDKYVNPFRASLSS